MIDGTSPLLQGLLPLAVEGWFRRWSGADFERRSKRWAELSEVCTTVRGERLSYDGFSEALLYRTGRRGESAAEFNRAAELLALGSFQPGGIRFVGLRFEVVDGALQVSGEEIPES